MLDKLSEVTVHYKYGTVEMLINITIISIYIVTICYFIYCYISYNPHWALKLLLILSTFIITSVTTTAILLSPIGYKVTDTEVILTRLYKPIHIPIKEILSIDTVYAKDLKGAIRLVGSSGFYGYWGKFRNAKYGTFYMHAKKNQKMLYIKCNNGNQYIFQVDTPITKEQILDKISNNVLEHR